MRKVSLRINFIPVPEDVIENIEIRYFDDRTRCDVEFKKGFESDGCLLTVYQEEGILMVPIFHGEVDGTGFRRGRLLMFAGQKTS